MSEKGLKKAEDTSKPGKSASSSNDGKVVSLTERELHRRFSYAPQSEGERLALDGDEPPAHGAKLNNAINITLGKWVVVKLGAFGSNSVWVDKAAEALETFIKEHSYLSSDPTGILSFAFKRIVVDAASLKPQLVGSILETLLGQLRNCTRETPVIPKNAPLVVRLGKFRFVSKAALRCKVRDILQSATANELLVEDNRDLLLELLKYHPKGKDKLQFCTGIYVGMDSERGYRSFFVKRQANTLPDEDFSYVRALEFVPDNTTGAYILLCSTITHVVKLFPRSVCTLINALEKEYPRSRAPPDEQVAFMRACLELAERLPSVRSSILRLIIQQLMALDSEIKQSEVAGIVEGPQFEAWKERQLRTLALAVERGTLQVDRVQQLLAKPNWLQTLFQQVRCEEDVDPMECRLDWLLAAFMNWLEQYLLSNRTVMAPKQAALAARSMLSDTCAGSGGSSAVSSATYSAASDCGLGEPADEPPELSIATCCVAELLALFRSLIMPAKKVKFVQYIMLFVASLNPDWSEKIMQLLFNSIFNLEGAVSLRKTAAVYVGSFVSRAAFLSPKFVRSALGYLCDFLREFLESNTWVTRRGTRKFLRVVNPQLQNLMHTVCEAIVLILCYQADTLRWPLDLLEDRSILEAGSTKSPMAKPLDDLTVLSGEEDTCFIKIMATESLGAAAALSTPCLRAFIELTDRVPILRPLKKQLSELLQTRLSSSEPEAEGNPSEQSEILQASESPFRKYTLAQSGRFVVRKLTDWNTVQQRSEVALKLCAFDPFEVERRRDSLTAFFPPSIISTPPAIVPDFATPDPVVVTDAVIVSDSVVVSNPPVPDSVVVSNPPVPDSVVVSNPPVPDSVVVSNPPVPDSVVVSNPSVSDLKDRQDSVNGTNCANADFSDAFPIDDSQSYLATQPFFEVASECQKTSSDDPHLDAASCEPINPQPVDDPVHSHRSNSPQEYHTNSSGSAFSVKSQRSHNSRNCDVQIECDALVDVPPLCAAPSGAEHDAMVVSDLKASKAALIAEAVTAAIAAVTAQLEELRRVKSEPLCVSEPARVEREVAAPQEHRNFESREVRQVSRPLISRGTQCSDVEVEVTAVPGPKVRASLQWVNAVSIAIAPPAGGEMAVKQSVKGRSVGNSDMSSVKQLKKRKTRKAAETRIVGNGEVAEVAKSTSDVATPSGDVATPSGDVATSSGDVATSSGDVATSSGDVATSSGDVATPSGDVATPSGDVAKRTSDVAISSSPGLLKRRAKSKADKQDLRLLAEKVVPLRGLTTVDEKISEVSKASIAVTQAPETAGGEFSLKDKANKPTKHKSKKRKRDKEPATPEGEVVGSVDAISDPQYSKKVKHTVKNRTERKKKVPTTPSTSFVEGTKKTAPQLPVSDDLLSQFSSVLKAVQHGDSPNIEPVIVENDAVADSPPHAPPFGRTESDLSSTAAFPRVSSLSSFGRVYDGNAAAEGRLDVFNTGAYHDGYFPEELQSEESLVPTEQSLPPEPMTPILDSNDGDRRTSPTFFTPKEVRKTKSKRRKIIQHLNSQRNRRGERY